VALSHLFHGFIFIAFFDLFAGKIEIDCPAIFLVRVRRVLLGLPMRSLAQRLELGKGGSSSRSFMAFASARLLWLPPVQDCPPLRARLPYVTHPLDHGDLLCSDGTQRQIVPSNDKHLLEEQRVTVVAA